ncbi:MAG: hypothetical protein MPW15_06870 [Candidatus Manganitrophus sp.]|nr:hypothetical protein [Candidatus Manganitrophus sp.]
MAIFNKTKPIQEYEAEGETERIYYEIRQTLRVSGVPQLFCSWAGHGRFLPLVWNALQPNAETRAFEEASDRLRAEAARLIKPMEKPEVSRHVRLGESQTYHIRASLDLYHYLYPKLLLLSAAVQLALAGGRIGKEETRELERIERGAPAGMIAMELAPEEPHDPRLRELFEEMKKISKPPVVIMDIRTLALWPDYLIEARNRLMPIVVGWGYKQAMERLGEAARKEARRLPYAVSIPREKMKGVVPDGEQIAALTSGFERAYARCILNIGLLECDWKDPDLLVASPFPASSRPRIAAAGGMG